ncbi:pyridoxamine 5'-phosphate oxidase family protein [Porticoccaceae bacterium]|nr:pyridoxamine 5'-phosphate oxidase family protein [Porticoccaceae bacterium]
MLSADVKKYIDRSVLCWLATCSSDGTPNVSPKEMFVAEDDKHLLIANISSPGTVANISNNPVVCISFIDVFVQKGYKLKGIATNIDKDAADYFERVKPLKIIVGGAFSIRSIIVVEITEVHLILAPSYQFCPETTEEIQIQTAMHTYGVQPVK